MRKVAVLLVLLSLLVGSLAACGMLVVEDSTPVVIGRCAAERLFT